MGFHVCSPICCPFSKLCHAPDNQCVLCGQSVPGPASGSLRSLPTQATLLFHNHVGQELHGLLHACEGNRKSFLQIWFKNNLQVYSISCFYAQMKRIMPVPDKTHLSGPVFPRHEFMSLIVYLSQQLI